jgi:replicative DNA helicase
MEMTRDQFWVRLLARVAQVDAKRLAAGKLVFSEWRRVLAAEKELATNPLPIYIDDTTYDATEIVNKASEMVARHGFGLVAIDYLQMATNLPGETDYQKNSRVPRQYKLLAKGMGVPVLCLAQMNREGEDLTEESETLDRVIEGSGKIEQYADIIFFLLGPRAPGIVRRVLVQHKDRHREAGHRVEFDFNQSLMTFQTSGAWAAQAQAINQTIRSNTPGVVARSFFSNP